jgi:hypothetical protein
VDVLGGHRERRADAEAAERAGVHPVTRAVHLHVPGGVGDDVAAVTDHDPVGVEPFGDLAGEPQRMHRRGVRRRRLHRASTRRPLRSRSSSSHGESSDLPNLPSCSSRARRNAPTSAVTMPSVDRPVVADLVGLRVDVDDGDVVEVARAAPVPEPEVEVDAEREDDVGMPQCVPAGQPEQVRVRHWQDPARHAVDVHRQLRQLDDCRSVGSHAGPVGPRPGHDHRIGADASRSAAARPRRDRRTGTVVNRCPVGRTTLSSSTGVISTSIGRST